MERELGHNLLPRDGELIHLGTLFEGEASAVYQNRLQNEIRWKNDEAIIFGKHIVTKRMYAWYAEKELEYTYSKITRKAQVWSDLLLEIKGQVESATGATYNSCLLNLYPTGEEGMAWHSDDEKDLKPLGSIASLSFGASRKFALKHKETKERIDLVLHSGELIEMKGSCQLHWWHALPKSKRVHDLRINLTFRQMLD